MARPSKFTHEQILDAALGAVAVHDRGTTLDHVCARLGAPVGSIYHRFPAREHLFVSLWLRSIRRYHAGLLAAATLADPREALAACTLHLPRFCRSHPDDAVAMTLYRQQTLAASAPPALAEAVRTVNDPVIDALDLLCERRFGRRTPHLRTIVATAVRQCPYGLVRPYVGGEVPAWLDDAVVAAGTAILALGDAPEPEAPELEEPEATAPAGGEEPAAP